MYVPEAFRVTDSATIAGFIEREPFAVVVTQGESSPLATHVPLLYDADANGGGILSGHMARANPQWRSFDGTTVLAIFHGPHGYISPSLYDGDRNVPTWDYTAVHIYGRANVVENVDESSEIVRRLARRMETGRAEPWDVESLPEDYLRNMLRGIVAFRIHIERVEAQFKLSQNRSAAERQRVAAHLARSENANERALSPLIPLMNYSRETPDGAQA